MRRTAARWWLLAAGLAATLVYAGSASAAGTATFAIERITVSNGLLPPGGPQGNLHHSASLTPVIYFTGPGVLITWSTHTTSAAWTEW
jgi:hypothetical protein